MSLINKDLQKNLNDLCIATNNIDSMLSKMNSTKTCMVNFMIQTIEHFNPDHTEHYGKLCQLIKDDISFASKIQDNNVYISVKGNKYQNIIEFLAK